MARYNNYFQHWRDYTFICAVFAMVGLAIAIYDWEATFRKEFRDPNSVDSETKELIKYLNNVL